MYISFHKQAVYERGTKIVKSHLMKQGHCTVIPCSYVHHKKKKQNFYCSTKIKSMS